MNLENTETVTDISTGNEFVKEWNVSDTDGLASSDSGCGCGCSVVDF